MAKLSVYNTIDRSQLGGKFVPLIQSGVSNYKILASDLGKEYHPGDAIEITDTGEINVNYDQNTLELSGSELSVKTDYDRGVFKGSDGIYIASADDSIGISRTGIKVNPESFVGSGLSYHKHRLSVNAKAPLSADADGLSLLIGGAGLEIVSGCLYLDSSVVSHTAADAVYYYMSTRTGSSLAIDQDYLVVDTKYIASAGLTTGFGNYNPISVDIKYVANAIGNTYIGSGLYWDNNNYTLSANVNTATGIIVNDNKLYLNAGYGLHTTNNTVRVKAANNSIGVSSAGIKVDTYYLAGHGLSSYYGTLLCVHSADKFIKVAPTGVGLHYQNLISSLANSSGGSSNIKIAYNYLYTATGDGLCWGRNNAIYVKSANSTIDVSSSGISVNPGYSLSSTSVGLEVNPSNDTLIVDSGGVSVNTSYLAGYGLSSVSNSLEVKPADDTIYVSSTGIGVNRSALSIPTAISLAGYGLSAISGGLYVKSADNTIGVSSDGIKVNAGYGLSAIHNGLYVKSADGSIDVSTDGVYVKAGEGLETTPIGLSVKSADGSIFVDGSGIGVDLRKAKYVGSGLTNSTGELAVKAADASINVSSAGISVHKSALSIPDAHSLAGLGLLPSSEGKLAINYGHGLETKYSGLYVKSADDTIDVSSYGIKVNSSALAGHGLRIIDHSILYVKSADNTIDVSSAGIKVNAGYGLSVNGYHGLFVQPADNTIGVSSAGIKVNTLKPLVGLGLEWSGAQALYVKSADNSIDVSDSGIRVNSSSIAGHGLIVDTHRGNKINIKAGSGLVAEHKLLYVKLGDGLDFDTSGAIYVTSGIGVNVTSGGGLLTGTDGLYIDSGQLAGNGLAYYSEQNNVKLYVKSADNTIDVSSAGIKVNTSALSIPTTSSLAGQGLRSNASGKLDIYYGSGLDIDKSLGKVIVKSADNSIDVSDNGIKVRTYDNRGVFVGNHGVYIRSADSSIGLSTAGIKVNTSALAGHGLIANPEGKLDIYYGPGLSIDTTSSMVYVNYGSGLGVDSSGKLYAASSATSDIGKGLWLASDNNDLLSVYAGSGLMFDTMNRVSVYAGSGLALVGPEGYGSLQVKAGSKNTISVSVDGIEVNAGPGLCYAGSLYIQSADNSINVATDGITVNYGDGLFMNDSSKLAVNVGYGLGIDENGGLARLISHSIDGANWYKKYQDGWIEQGGYFSSNSQEATVTLNTAFANTNYTLMVTSRTGGSSPNYNPAISEKTTTSFKYNSMIAKAFGAEYYACGY